MRNLPASQGYCDSRGLYSARKAVMQYCQQIDIPDRGRRRRSTSATGASELIVMSMQGLLHDGDEVLLPSPDYPLWTAAVRLGGRRAGALPVRRAVRLDAGPRRRAAVAHHAPDQGPGHHQPEQPHGRRLQPRLHHGSRALGRIAGPDRVRRRDLRQGHLRRRGVRAGGFDPGGRPDGDLQRALQGLPGRRLPHRLGWC